MCSPIIGSGKAGCSVQNEIIWNWNSSVYFYEWHENPENIFTTKHKMKLLMFVERGVKK